MNPKSINHHPMYEMSFVLEAPPVDGFRVEPSTELHVTRRLGGDLVHGAEVLAFRPTSFAFDDPRDWVVLDFQIHLQSQIPRSAATASVRVLAGDLEQVIRRGRRECNTLQVGQDLSMVVSPTRPGLRFRCVMRGPWLSSRDRDGTTERETLG